MPNSLGRRTDDEVRMPKRRDNLILLGVDSLWADHMSCYGYQRLTTPHIDRFAGEGVLFERNYSPHIPTTSAYATMLTGMDCFSHEVVALRHQGGLTDRVKSLAEILKEQGYSTTCVGFSGNPSSRGFDTYLNFAGWGSWKDRPSRKAENLNDVALPELERLAADAEKEDQPFFLFLRHMDPHSPYLPPEPFEHLFYSGDPCDPGKSSMQPVLSFKPFCDYFATWMPPGITDAEYIIAQYDGAVAYMDACIQRIFTRLEELGLADNTLVVLNGDHGETLMDHECYFDHHGLYDCTLHVPLIMRHPKLPRGRRVSGYTLHQDLVPSILELLGVKTRIRFDGKSLLPLVRGERASNWSDFYITECTWMRKHGWRTPEWKLIEALEPDFHFKPQVELYNLVEDPGESNNVAEQEPGIVAALKERMQNWIARREGKTKTRNPMETNLNWHGSKTHQGPFTSSQQAYDTLHIGDPGAAARLQARDAEPEPEEEREAVPA
jgi:arylsulfatase A-like enzyme